MLYKLAKDLSGSQSVDMAGDHAFLCSGIFSLLAFF